MATKSTPSAEQGKALRVGPRWSILFLRPLYVACKPKACVPPQAGKARLGFQSSSSGAKNSDWTYGMFVRIQFGKEFVGCGYKRKNQPRIGANLPFGRSESDLQFLTFAIQLRCLAHPFIGTVRANPVGAPAPPAKIRSIEKSRIKIN